MLGIYAKCDQPVIYSSNLTSTQTYEQSADAVARQNLTHLPIFSVLWLVDWPNLNL